MTIFYGIFARVITYTNNLMFSELCLLTLSLKSNSCNRNVAHRTTSIYEMHRLICIYTPPILLVNIVFCMSVCLCIHQSLLPCQNSYILRTTHAQIQKQKSEGSNFFLLNEWTQIQLKSGHHRPASETPFK